MRRKIIKLGRSAVVSLPPGWLKGTNLDVGKEVSVTMVDDKLIVGRTEVKGAVVPHHKLDRSDARRISAIVYADYLGGYDGVAIEVPSILPETYNHLKELCSKLHGVSLYLHETKLGITLAFSDILGKSVLNNLERCFNILKRMYLANLESIGQSYNDKERLEANSRMIATDEDEVDRTSTYILRLLNKSLYDPEFFYETDIRDRRNVIPYAKIAMRVERLADLQEEIAEHLVRNYRDFIEKRRVDFRLTSKKLGQLYDKCFKLVEIALKNIRNPNEAYQLIGLRQVDQLKGFNYWEGVIERSERENLFKFFLGKYYKCPEFLPEITILQSKIYAMSSIARNIAECSSSIILPGQNARK